MKRIYFLLVFVFICLNVSAQKDTLSTSKSPVDPYNGTDTTRSKVLRKRYYIGILGSPDYSFRSLSTNSNDPNQIAALSYRNSSELAKISYTAGLDVLYQFNTRFSLSIGFQYSVKGEMTNAIPTVQVSNNPTTGQPTDTINGTAKINYKTTYVDVPVKLNYYFKEGKIAPYLMIGISPNIYIHDKEVADIKLNNGTNFTNTSTLGTGYYFVNPQAQIGFGIDYALPTSRIRIEPVYRMSFLKANDSPINEYFYSIGLNISYLFLVKN
jgi:hypothetical protein